MLATPQIYRSPSSATWNSKTKTTNVLNDVNSSITILNVFEKTFTYEHHSLHTSRRNLLYVKHFTYWSHFLLYEIWVDVIWICSWAMDTFICATTNHYLSRDHISILPIQDFVCPSSIMDLISYSFQVQIQFMFFKCCYNYWISMGLEIRLHKHIHIHIHKGIWTMLGVRWPHALLALPFFFLSFFFSLVRTNKMG